MTGLQKVITAIVLGAAVLALSVFAFVSYVFSDWGLCANTIYEEVTSPNNAYRAVVFERNCGATTGFSTQLSILHADETLEDAPGNTYIVDGQPEVVDLELTWLADDHLRIGNAAEAAFTAQTQIGLITVSYD